MTQSRTVVSAVVVTLALLVAACDSPDVTEPTNELAVAAPIATSASLGSANAQPRGMDALFVSLNREVPGFGGMFIEPDEAVLYVYLKDLGRSQGISTAFERRFGPSLLRQRVGREGTVKELTLKFLPAEFDAEELFGWKNSLYGVWREYGMEMLDLDERNNRVHVGVATQAMVNPVLEHASELGIPDGAVFVEVMSRAIPMSGPALTGSSATVNETVRGGIKVVNLFSTFSPTGECTLGFNAIRNGVRGFVTASHCTSKVFALDAPMEEDLFNSAGALIGKEYVDPLPIVEIPPSRNTDAAFIRLMNSTTNPWELGTLFLGSGEPVTEIFSREDMQIGEHWWEFSHPIMIGASIEKYGISTGLTTGVQNETCLIMNGGDPTETFVVRCLSKVVGPVLAGDSGGPVFQRSSWPAQGGVNIAGITSIGFAPQNVYFYSPVGEIVKELGALQILCQSNNVSLDPSDPLCNAGQDPAGGSSGGSGVPPGGGEEEDPPAGGCPPPQLICKE